MDKDNQGNQDSQDSKQDGELKEDKTQKKDSKVDGNSLDSSLDNSLDSSLRDGADNSQVSQDNKQDGAKEARKVAGDNQGKASQVKELNMELSKVAGDNQDKVIKDSQGIKVNLDTKDSQDTKAGSKDGEARMLNMDNKEAKYQAGEDSKEVSKEHGINLDNPDNPDNPGNMDTNHIREVKVGANQVNNSQASQAKAGVVSSQTSKAASKAKAGAILVQVHGANLNQTKTSRAAIPLSAKVPNLKLLILLNLSYLPLTKNT